MLKFDWNILWVIVNLVLFYILIRFLLFKPIKKVLDKREKIISEQFEKAEKADAEADAKLRDYESRIANVETEGENIISRAKDSAKLEYNKIIEKAESDAQTIKENARKQMKAENESARRAAKEELASLAMETAEKLVKKNISAEVNSDIFDEFLNESSENQ